MNEQSNPGCLFAVLVWMTVGGLVAFGLGADARQIALSAVVAGIGIPVFFILVIVFLLVVRNLGGIK